MTFLLLGPDPGAVEAVADQVEVEVKLELLGDVLEQVHGQAVAAGGPKGVVGGQLLLGLPREQQRQIVLVGAGGVGDPVAHDAPQALAVLQQALHHEGWRQRGHHPEHAATPGRGADDVAARPHDRVERHLTPRHVPDSLPAQIFSYKEEIVNRSGGGYDET